MNVGPSAVKGESRAQPAARSVGEGLVHHVPLRHLALPVRDHAPHVPSIAARSASPERPATQGASCGARPACGREPASRSARRTRPARRRPEKRTVRGPARRSSTSSRFRAVNELKFAARTPAKAGSPRRLVSTAAPMRRAPATLRSGATSTAGTLSAVGCAWPEDPRAGRTQLAAPRQSNEIIPRLMRPAPEARSSSPRGAPVTVRRPDGTPPTGATPRTPAGQSRPRPAPVDTA